MGAPLVIPVLGERGSQRDPEPYLRGLTVVYDPQADAGAPLLIERDPCLDHRPVQHRDGKPPWCNLCGQP